MSGREGGDGSSQLVSPSRASTYRGVRAGIVLLSRREQVEGVVLTIAVVVRSLVAAFAVLSAIPVIQLVIQPLSLSTNPYLAGLYRAFGQPPFERFVTWLGFGVLVLLVVSEAAEWVVEYAINRYIIRCENRLAGELVLTVVAAPYSWFLTRNQATLARLLYEDPGQWSRGLVQRLLTIASGLMQSAVSIAAVLWMSSWTGTVSVAVVALLAYAAFKVTQPLLHRLTYARRANLDKTMVAGAAILAGIREIKLSSRERYFIDLFQSCYAATSVAYARMSVFRRGPATFLAVLGQTAVIGIVLVMWKSGYSAAAIATQLVVLYLIPAKVIPGASTFATAYGLLCNAFPYVDGIRAVMKSIDESKREEQARGDGGKPEVRDWNVIAVDDVSYGYPGASQLAIKHVSFELVRGKTYGIVGPSAAGKSTVVDLLVGLLRPIQGRICVEGLGLDEVKLKSWQRKIGYVPQVVYIADDTLRANVAFGVARADVDEGRVRQCLDLANLGGLEDSLEQGLDTRLGDRGTRLSGGQRQRIAIARALYNWPELLIFDEATSALDGISEREILDALDNLQGRMTIVIIAHRLTTVAHCDEIFVLEDGCLAGRGTYAELLAGHDLFQTMAHAGSPDIRRPERSSA